MFELGVDVFQRALRACDIIRAIHRKIDKFNVCDEIIRFYEYLKVTLAVHDECCSAFSGSCILSAYTHPISMQEKLSETKV